MPLLPYLNKDLIEAGCDEAGRGCLAGPVFAAAVILPQNYENLLLNDSKKLSEKHRNILREEIEKKALAWAVGWSDNQEIDKMNILRASIKSMHRAIDKLNISPEYILVDGNSFVPYKKIPFKTIIKGDGKYASIAAASILAKTYRDDFMKGLHNKYPDYLWDKNKGYPTKAHRQAIINSGISSFHRKSFRLLDEQMKINM
ncbi:ribonuclease HII [Bacteroidota bacterium]